ncbi:MAG: hypothetical protein J0651_02735, partial [Actinobacteria bacterium]|nr:hypothetical protein [Actinomycetota bacterium]
MKKLLAILEPHDGHLSIKHLTPRGCGMVRPHTEQMHLMGWALQSDPCRSEGLRRPGWFPFGQFFLFFPKPNSMMYSFVGDRFFGHA